jgi:predicted MPP superfamily phosphohydrolase
MAGRVGIKYLAGFFDVEGTQLYVTRGLGAGIPVRFRAPMEVAHLTLRHRAPAADAAA